MKSLLRIVLPILVVAGLAFGITFIKLYSPDEESTGDTGGTGVSKGSSRHLPLNFFTLLATAPKDDTNERGEKEIPNGKRHLKYWDPDVEVGAAGHYAFWCQNRNEKPVVVRVPRVSCQCAGADLAVVPADAYKDYLVASAFAGGPLCPSFMPAAAFAHVAFSRRLNWEVLVNPDLKHDVTVPPADPTTGPQLALVRLSWTGKAIGTKSIDADLFASIGDATPTHTELKAAINVVPAFDAVWRDGSGKWTPVREIQFGELNAESVVHHEFFLCSTTRTQMLFTIASEPSDACVTWTEPVPATVNELMTLQEAMRGEDKPNRRLKCLYKVQATVRERTAMNDAGKKELKVLDLGLLERKLTVTAVDAGTLFLTVKGRVLGDVTLLGGADSGKIDLGNSFSADQDNTRDVVLLTERPGLELSLSESEIVPNFLKVKLDPLPPLGERNQYRLRVTVPKLSLIGALPENSAVILKTNGPNSRRLRIPIKGTTFDPGGPRL